MDRGKEGIRGWLEGEKGDGESRKSAESREQVKQLLLAAEQSSSVIQGPK